MTRKKRNKLSQILEQFSLKATKATGTSMAFILALSVIIVWGVTGPLFHYSDTWQLVINTSTTIVTFLMVFLIQNTQNREAAATQMKLDEIIRVTLGAHNVLLDLEDRSDDELSVLRDHYASLASRARADVQNGLQDTGASSD